MGLLTAGQLAAIEGGARVRQVWKIITPDQADKDSATWTTYTIHDDAGSEKCVTDAGKRKVTGYNISMAVPGELRVGDYSITVSNPDGLFYVDQYPGYFWGTDGISSSYYADPQECLLRHEVYVMVDGAWSEITAVRYIGRIVDITYDDGGNHDGAQPGTATISSENNLVTELLRYEWTEDDGDDTDTTINLYQDT